MKYILVILSVFITSANILAQTDTTYYDSNWKKVEKSIADRCRIVEKHGDLYLVKDINVKTNLPQMFAFCTELEPNILREGKTTYYSETGHKSTEGNYEKDKRTGIWTKWEENEKDSLVIDCNIDGTYKNVFVPAHQSLNTDMNVEYKIEEMPEFPGGEKAMFQFISKNIKYPVEAQEAGIQGTCYVTFVIQKDGSISDVKLLRGVSGSPACDKEAMRVVNLMPNWKAGIQFGRAVRVQFNIPIKFKIS